MTATQPYSEQFLQISETPPDYALPWLDRKKVNLDLVRDPLRRAYIDQWREEGVVLLPGFMPRDLREAYFAVRDKLGLPGGWADPCPYLFTPEMRAISLYPPLLEILDLLIGYKMGLHLNLTGWISTGRAWHQDDYLNPDFVNSHYAAVWIALRDIDPKSGPFEYVPGSHRWPLTRRDKVLAHCPVKTSLSDPNWTGKTQDWVSGILQHEIDSQGAEVKQLLAKEGDVLIWHGRLFHRGSTPVVPGTPRHSLIAHYSAIKKRLDMGKWKERCFLPGDRASEWK